MVLPALLPASAIQGSCQEQVGWKVIRVHSYAAGMRYPIWSSPPIRVSFRDTVCPLVQRSPGRSLLKKNSRAITRQRGKNIQKLKHWPV